MHVDLFQVRMEMEPFYTFFKKTWTCVWCYSFLIVISFILLLLLLLYFCIAGVNANAIVIYHGELIDEEYVKAGGWDDEVDHIVSIVGWKTVNDKQYWIVRNSWGTYWGNLGFFYVQLGKNLLGIESEVSWATPGVCTERNFPCDEDGANCSPTTDHHPEDHFYVDPSLLYDGVTSTTAKNH